jgi:glycine cleavage system transcriptional repressor
MDQYAVITAVGPDRPGLVDVISKFILDTGCNIEDSRMAVLGGEFAMVVLVAGDADRVSRVIDGAEAAGSAAGLAIGAKRTRAPGEGASAGVIPYGVIPYKVSAYSMDHPGIVQQVSHFLGERGINVRALDTRVTSAPVTGQPLFSLRAVIDVPADENVQELRRGLEEIGAAENIDIEIKPAK